jgi:hypothetical protein
MHTIYCVTISLSLSLSLHHPLRLPQHARLLKSLEDKVKLTAPVDEAILNVAKTVQLFAPLLKMYGVYTTAHLDSTLQDIERYALSPQCDRVLRAL